MKTVYDRIKDMRGNLITVSAEGVALGELARIDLKDGRSVYSSVLRIEGKDVTLQVFQSTRGNVRLEAIAGEVHTGVHFSNVLWIHLTAIPPCCIFERFTHT